MKISIYIHRIFILSFLILCFFESVAQPLSLDQRAYKHYSSSQISSFSGEKIEMVNFYFSQSFIVNKGNKVCATCPEINPQTFDVTSVENMRLKDRRSVVFLTEPGYPVELLSLNELSQAYLSVSSNGLTFFPQSETVLLRNVQSVFDSKGANQKYSDNTNHLVTYSTEPGMSVRLSLNMFDTEAGFDFLTIYDGAGTSGKVLAVYSGRAVPHEVVSLSNSMTLMFTSDASVAGQGYAGIVSSVNQILLNPNNQDCLGAIPVCQNVYTQPISYSGTGNIPGEINSSISCLGSGEKNDVWYQFTTQTAGTICFSITPNNFSEDYDWAVYDLTNANCSDIATNASLSISCNYSGAGGVTGANGFGGSQNNACINVTAGQSLVLNVSNFSSSQNGYTLDFSASTAQMFDNVPPQILSVVTPVCGATSMTFNFSENVLCNTVTPGDFVVNGPGGPYTITSLTGGGCAAGAANENTFTVTLNQPLTTPGNYSICLTNAAGSVTDLCGNVAPAACLNFNIADITAGFAPVATQCLTGNNFSFTNTSSSTAAGPITYNWDFPGATPSTSTAINPTNITWNAAGNYVVTLTVTQGTCSETYSQTVSALLPATAGSAMASPAFICAGSCTNLTLSNYQGTIQWQSATSAAGPYVDIPGANTSPYQVCPTGITFYRANVLGCSNAVSNYVQVSVNPTPNVQIQNNHLSVCPGGSTTISASGAGIYSWNPGPGSGANFTVSPTVTTTYTVTGTGSGCKDTAIAIVNVTPAPDVQADPDVAICQGSTVVLNVTGAASYTWNPATGLSSATASTVTSNPASTTTYTITGTGGTNCYDYDTLVVSVLPPPVADAGADASTCEGSSVTLTAQGGTSYSWSPATGLSSTTGSSVIATPVSTTTYTVTASIGDCTSIDEVIVNVIPMPVPVASQDVTICSSSLTVLSATGGADYSWSPLTDLNPSNGIGSTVTASPLSTTTYTVTASNSFCTATDEVIVTVVPTPFTDAGSDKYICINQSATLTASGATNYTWSPATGLNSTTGSVVTASPLTTTTYTVTGSNNNCSFVDYVVVYVQTTIQVVASADAGICPSDSTTISVSGAATYSWSPATGLSSVTDPVLVASPSATTTYTVTGTLNGCVGNDEIIVSVLPLPVVNAGSDVTICEGSQTQLTATGAQTYSWSPSAGLDNPSSSTPIASPATTTTYTLTGTSSSGCVNYDTLIVNINLLPAADFFVQDTCEYLALNFSDNSIAPGASIQNWFWDFGDNTTSTDQHPSHQYSAAGQYQVTLVVQTNTTPSCASVISKTVNVYPKPVAAISATEVCEGLATSFINNSTVSSGTIITHSWTFGDGNTATSETPSHHYSVAGSYNSQLIISSDHNCLDTATATVVIKEKPDVDFTSSIVCQGNETSFTNNSSVPGGPAFTSSWNFGDGVNSASDSPVHLFTSSGSHDVQLVISTSEGCTDSVSKQVQVYHRPIAQFVSDGVCIGSETHFSDKSIVQQPALINTWAWQFGDGNNSTVQNPVHQYSLPGSYTAELIVSTIEGCIDTTSVGVEVYANPVAAIWSDVTAGCDPLCVNFRDTSYSSANDIINWSWDFDDNSPFGSSKNPQHCFGQGDYNVRLTVTTINGCTSTSAPYAITSYPLPVAEFVYGPQKVSIVNPVIKFIDESVNGSQWFWNFGDSVETVFNSQKDQLEHTYADTGIFCVNLLVVNNYGCRDSVEHCVEIHPDYAIYAPNAFSPNGDGRNDEFIPVSSGIDQKGFEMRIFDRWGNLSYYTNDISKGWNGNYNNNGNAAPADVYVYTIEFRDMQGLPQRITGRVTIVR